MADVLTATEVTVEEVHEERYGDWAHMRDLSNWDVPKIRFVEAIKDPEKWLLPPREKKNNS